MLSTDSTYDSSLENLELAEACLVRSGASSSVYKCPIKSSDMFVCLKEVYTSRSSTSKGRKEYNTLKLLHSYHGCPDRIIGLHGFLVNTSAKNMNLNQVLVLELCEFSLDDMIRGLKSATGSSNSTRSLLSHYELSAIIASLAVALVFLESVGIVHNDIKSSNILWKRSTGDGIWKLADFGSARTTPFSNSKKHTGTLSTSSPELIMGSISIGFKSDVWSLGCVLWEAIHLVLPFDFNDLHAFQNGYETSSKFPVSKLIRSPPCKSKSRHVIGKDIMDHMLQPVVERRWSARESFELAMLVDTFKIDEHLEPCISVRARDI